MNKAVDHMERIGRCLDDGGHCARYVSGNGDDDSSNIPVVNFSSYDLAAAQSV